MSVVIIGGNECMVRKYKELCSEYGGSAKVFVKESGGLKNKIGRPTCWFCLQIQCPIKCFGMH